MHYQECNTTLATRKFSGTPTAAGTFNVTVTASDGTASVSDVFAIEVIEPGKYSLMVTGESSTNGVVDGLTFEYINSPFPNGLLKLYKNGSYVSSVTLDASGSATNFYVGNLAVGDVVSALLVGNGVTYITHTDWKTRMGTATNYYPIYKASPLVLDLNGDDSATFIL